ncbi:MAG: hypothetical protein MK207_16195, partial [Saprospiraceae bacterium]|nr:hypothetical protein [Saprospiraceae bacterium]
MTHLKNHLAGILLIFVLTLFVRFSVNGQCTFTSMYPYHPVAAPTFGPTTIDICNYAGEYSEISSVISGTTYTAEMVGGGYITVVDANGIIVDYGTSPLTWTASSNGIHQLHWSLDPMCLSSYTCITTTLNYVSGTGGTPSTGMNVTLHMYDYAGDGWNTNMWEASGVNGANTYGPFTLSSGYYGTQSFSMAPDCYDTYCDFGASQPDVFWELIDDNSGLLIASGGAPYLGFLPIGSGTCPSNDPCINDTIGPVVALYSNSITFQLDSLGALKISPIDFDSVAPSDNCTPFDSLIITLSKTDFDCSDIGTYQITYNCTDQSGNSTHKTRPIIIQDTIKPRCEIPPNHTLYLETGFLYTELNPTNLDSLPPSDNCTPVDSLTRTLSKSFFDCSDVGLNATTYSVTDKSGNSSTGTVIVNVVDTIRPIIVLKAGPTIINLDSLGTATIEPSDVDSASTDNCSIANMSLSKTNFGCPDLGPQSVVLTVTDSSGNASTDTSIVTVQDPTGFCTFQYGCTDPTACNYDSIATVDDGSCNYSTSNTTTHIACDSFTWPVNGQTYTQGGIYTSVSTNAAGCPHTETLYLTINYSTSNSTTIDSCISYTWPVDGQTYLQSGIYYSFTTNAAGCPDTEILNLTISNHSTNTTYIDYCDSYTWPLDSQTYTQSGTFYVHTLLPNGCYHNEILHLTINYSTSNTTTHIACDSFTWPVDGQTYTQNGTYIHLSTNASGCPHTETLHLTINYSTSNTTYQTSCDSFTWSVNGQTYTQTGTYTDVSTNAAGCPHTETLYLTINNSIFNVTTHTACDSFTWSVNGQTYTQGGIYTSVSTNAAGCQHIEELVLTIYPSSYHTFSIDTCYSYTWIDGNTYTQSGVYTYVYNNGYGCAQTMTLHLTINNSTSNTTYQTACDSYTWPVNGQTYTQTGTYTDVSTNAAGCSHTETLQLTINNSNACNFTTAQDGSWHTGSTWVGGTVPPTTADVIIDHNVTVGSNITHTGSMTISFNNSLTISAGHNLSHSGALDNNGNIFGPYILTGTSRAINIGDVEDLIVSVTGTVSPNASFSISRLLRVDTGATIDVTGHQAMLLADASRTALVHDNGGFTVGDFTVEQFIPQAGNPYANIFYTSPVNYATIGQIDDDFNLLLTGNPNSYYYDETTGQWVAPASLTHPIANGEGFYQYAFVPGGGVVFDFTGTLNTGNISIPITNTGGGGWNIIGNPYPSPINLQLLWDMGNNPAVYYRYQDNGYSTLIAPLGISNPPGLTINAALMQGFWVNAGGITSVDLDNSMRITDPAASVDNFTKSTIPLFRLAMEYQSERITSVVYFYAAATDCVDENYDGLYLDGDISFQFATKTGNTNMSINGLPELTGLTDTIPLYTEISVIGNYTISLTEISNFSSGTTVMLQDLLLSVSHDLTKGDYNYIGNPVEGNDRFIITVLSSAATGTSEVEDIATFETFRCFESLCISLPKELQENASINIYNALGQNVYSSTLEQGKQFWSIDNVNLSGTNVYFVDIEGYEKASK